SCAPHGICGALAGKSNWPAVAAIYLPHAAPNRAPPRPGTRRDRWELYRPPCTAGVPARDDPTTVHRHPVRLDPRRGGPVMASGLGSGCSTSALAAWEVRYAHSSVVIDLQQNVSAGKIPGDFARADELVDSRCRPRGQRPSPTGNGLNRYGEWTLL